jgi:hypothetical protein
VFPCVIEELAKLLHDGCNRRFRLLFHRDNHQAVRSHPEAWPVPSGSFESTN